MFRLSAQGGAREQIFEKQVRRPALSTTVKKILGYSTRNGKFKRLEPHFQLSATRSVSKDGMETAATLTGVRPGAHACLAKLWLKGKVRS